MEVTVELIEPENYNFPDEKRPYNEQYDVTVGDKRILTLYTDGDFILSKWISKVRKTHRNKKTPLIVTLRVDREIQYGRSGLFDNPYDILTLSIGADTLIYELPLSLYYFNPEDHYYRHRRHNSVNVVPSALKELFSDSKMIFVSLDIEEIAEKLYRDFRLKVARFVDVRTLAEKVYEDEGVYMSKKDVKRLWLHEITKKLLGKELCVRRYRYLRWRKGWKEINIHYVKFLTTDTYLFHEMAIKYMDDVKQLSSK